MEARVECYAGSRGAEEPRALVFPDGRRVRIAAILGRWRTPEHRGFRVRCEDGGLYRLRHDEAADGWEVEGA